MSDLLITLTQLQFGPIPMQSFTEWGRTQIREARGLIIAFGGLVVLALVVWRIIKSGVSLGSIIMAGLAAAFAIWLFTGGIDVISALLDDQAKVK